MVASLPLLKITWDLLAKEPYSLQEPGKPNVLIIVFDALSADNVSLYGYPRQTTPNFARFAENATVFHRHYSGGNFTTPGTASLLTGSYPWSHRAFQLYGTVTDAYLQRNLFSAFSSSTFYKTTYTHNDLAATLLYQFVDDINLLKKTRDLCLFDEILFAEGAFVKDRNAAFIGERTIVRGQRGQTLQLPSSLFLAMLHRIWRTREKTGLQAKYKKLFPRGLPSTNATPFFFLLEDAIDWVQSQITSVHQPYLGYFHFMPPHEPYNTRREFVGIFNDDWKPVSKPPHYFTQGFNEQTLQQHRREYDEYIAYVDAEFGRLYDFMQTRGLLENTVLVLTSDHGELFERGILEHNTPALFDPVMHVPLVISRAGQRGRSDVYTPTSCVDVLPTLLKVTGQAIPDWCEGVVLPTFTDQPASPERSIYTIEAKSNPKHAPLTEGTVAMMKDRYKLIHYLGYNSLENADELYDLVDDPEELNNLATSNASLAVELKSELQAKIVEVNQPYRG
jgi:arylsulfatase A-like enzyme